MKKGLVLLFTVAMVFAFSASASADEKTVEERLKALEDKTSTWSPSLGAWSFYGSARFLTFYEESSKTFSDVKLLTDLADSTNTSSAANYATAKDKKTTLWGLQNNARLGATVDKGDLGGKIEIGFNPDSRGTNGNVYTRLIYGTYKLNKNTIFLVGQDYTPLDFTTFSNQVFGSDADLFYYGSPYESRVPQIKVTMGGFQAALIKPGSADTAGAPSASNAKTEVILPRLDLRYTANMGMFTGDVYGGAGTYKVKSRAGTSIHKDVTSYLAGLKGGITVSPVYVNALAWTGQNVKQMGISQASTLGALFNAAGTKLKNSSDFGWALVAGGNIQKCTVEAGYGYTQSKNSYASGADNAATAKARSYYLQTVIPVAAMNGAKFSITPEIGVIDNMKNEKGENLGTDKYAGAQWRVDF